MCTQLFLSKLFILAANLSLALPVVAGIKMLPSTILPLEQLLRIWCLKHQWALIYTSPNIVEVVVAKVGN